MYNWLRHSNVVKRLGLLALLSLASGTLATPATGVGERVPEIYFDEILPNQPVSNASFEAFTGKVVVLEMWATWCGACVSAIPHLNELAEEFKDRGVVFLSVTDEEPAKVEAFLKERPIRGLVGIAHTHRPATLYDAGIPSTFLIDASGKIAGRIDPGRLTAPMLEGLMRGQALPAIDLKIQQSHTLEISHRLGLNSEDMKNASLRSIVSSLWGIRESRLIGEPLNDKNAYDVSLSIPGATSANFRSWERNVIAGAFHIKVNRETRDTEVWVLTKTPVKPPTLQPAGTISDLNYQGWFPAIPPKVGGSLKLLNSEVSFLAQFLETAARRPVVDETGINGKYDINVSYDKADPDGIIEAMQKSGFKIEPAHRMIEFLVVTRAD
jgi:uncharacterized protein (TIGR03435 family)